MGKLVCYNQIRVLWQDLPDHNQCKMSSRDFSGLLAEAYLGPCETSIIELFGKWLNCSCSKELKAIFTIYKSDTEVVIHDNNCL